MKWIFPVLIILLTLGWIFDRPKKKKTKEFGEGMFEDTPNSNHYQNF